MAQTNSSALLKVDLREDLIGKSPSQTTFQSSRKETQEQKIQAQELMRQTLHEKYQKYY